MRRVWEQQEDSPNRPIPPIAVPNIPPRPVQIPQENPMEEQVEEEDTQEEEIIEQQPSNPVRRAKLGEVRPFYQQVGFEVFKGYEKGKEVWVPVEKYSDAEILGYIYSRVR